ncbi:MAG: hypothetical protein KF774_06055 [Planctomyces sp.]|nr:hypothetical protein [Planctomyces sp.]
MTQVARRMGAVFVDRCSQSWIVRDPDGNFWILPSAADGWRRRQPYDADKSDHLEPVPAHYRTMLGLPF